MDRHPTERDVLEIGTETAWGRIVGVQFVGGERYYWCLTVNGITEAAMIPAVVMEAEDDE